VQGHRRQAVFPGSRDGGLAVRHHGQLLAIGGVDAESGGAVHFDIPHIGDVVETQGVRVTVLQTLKQRVTLVQIEKVGGAS